MINCFRILLICVIAISCDKPDGLLPGNEVAFSDLRNTTKYHIKKGNHYAEQNAPQVMHRDSISATVTFDSSAVYTSVDPGNQADVNKLLGFSDCSNDHQQNSARMGWSWNGHSLELYAYAYTQKSRTIKSLGNFDLKKPVHCLIRAKNRYYYFQAGSSTDSIPRYCDEYNGSRYKLFPYFGGDETAPHEIIILIAED